MPAKDIEQRRATARACYQRNKHVPKEGVVVRRKANRTARQQQIVAWLAELKNDLVCRRCGESHPGCLQFHHPDPAAKEQSVADAVRRGWSRERIHAELKKCEVLCANCHAKHHAKERAS